MLETLKASKSQFSKKGETTGQDLKKFLGDTGNIVFNQGNTPTNGLNKAGFNSPMRILQPYAWL
jgi:hypothetical protein